MPSLLCVESVRFQRFEREAENRFAAMRIVLIALNSLLKTLIAPKKRQSALRKGGDAS